MTRYLLSIVVAMLIACGGKTTAPTPPPPVVEAPPPPVEPPLPLYSAVKRGVLSNGLTYYVLPHGKPEKRAFLWLAVNAGSVQEDDDQRGLAHFVEHMAFNGTKRFPKQDLVNTLEAMGVKFGPDLNAYTSFDETVYQLQVPTDDPALVDKGFDILRDWTADIAFDPAEVEKERGVVLEEWRLGRGAQQRLLDKLIKVVFAGSRYADRLPIGLPEILQKAPREKLVKFYKDWYRPDRMAVIAVGDFDAAAIEKQITEKFGDLPKAGPPRPEPKLGAPATTGTRVAVETDAELPIAVVGVANIVARRSEATASDYRRKLSEQLYQAMLNERLQTIARRPDAPFVLAAVVMQGVTRQFEAFARFAVVKGDDSEGALKSLFAEVTRVEQHGFVRTELDRARTNLTRTFEQMAATAETVNGRDRTAELVRHFLSGEVVIGPTAERDLALEMLPKITLAELNGLARSYGGAENRVIVLAGPDGSPQPAKQRVLAIVDEVGKLKTDPWVDKEAGKLAKSTPNPGSIAKESTNDKLGTTEWKLSNGVRVIVKPTDYEQDAVSIVGTSPGGLGVVKQKDFIHARFADEIAATGGVGELDADALGKALAGKRVSVSASIDEVTETIDASGSVRDLETMLHLVHLRMAQPRSDAEAFAVWKRNTAEQLAKLARSPDAEFGKRSQEVLWQKHPRRLQPEPADIEKIDHEKALAFYSDRFGDAGDFTFVIVGAVDVAKLKPLVETYLASLPATDRKEKPVDSGARRVGGVVAKTWNLGQDQDKARVQLLFHGDEKWSRDKERDMFVLGQVVSIRLREILREDLGGVYGVGASGQLSRAPRQERTFTIQFGTAPTTVEKLVDATFAEIAAIAKSGIGPEYLEKVKQTFVREREVAMRTNGFWADWLARAARFGDDPAIILDTAPVIARMTSANVKAAAARYLDRKRLYRAVMLPAKTP